jgi:hypothetical protein
MNDVTEQFIGFDYPGGDGILKTLKSLLFKDENAKVEFSNMIFINAMPMPYSAADLSQFLGVRLAEQTAAKYPDKNILIITPVAPESLIKKQAPQVEELIARPNIALIDGLAFPWQGDYIQSIKLLFTHKNSDLSDSDLQKILTDNNQKALRIILHNMEPAKVKDVSHPQDEKEEYWSRQALEKIHDHFPVTQTMTDREAVEFIKSIPIDRPEPMKGKTLDGVYSDFDGTYWVDGKPNPAVEADFEKYKKEGKAITLWTDGDLEAAQKKLKAAHINYPIVAKADYAGATAEIVLDDQDITTFTTITKIRPKKFIQVMP